MQTIKTSTNYTITGDNDIKIIAEVFEETNLTIKSKRKITIHKTGWTDSHCDNGFVFMKSNPSIIKQIGELLIEASKLE